MTQVQNLIEKFESEGLSNILLDPSFVLDLETAKAELDGFEGSERADMEAKLSEILKALEEHAEILVQTKSNLKAQLEKTEKAQAACLAYLDAKKDRS